MSEQIVIRFRDLTVELGGTIRDHRDLLRKYGEVWWGWFMQPYETVPRVLFGRILQQIEDSGPVDGVLFDTGQSLFYQCVIGDIKVAPTERGVASPAPERSPEYYHRGRYSAWFRLLQPIEDRNLEDLQLRYAGFPTRPDMTGDWGELIGNRIESANQLRNLKATLWHVNSDAD